LSFLNRLSRVFILGFLVTIFAAADIRASESDTQAIREAVFDYANSVYQVKPELIEKSVHPHLQKVGYVFRDGPRRELWMNYYELVDLAASWNKEGRFDPETAKREVRVLEVFDQIAVARLDAEWGVDYFHLARRDDGSWQIMNVIWQAYPPGDDAQ